MNIEPFFVLNESLRLGALRTSASGGRPARATTAATIERLMRSEGYADAARVALLAQRQRAASQAMRCAVARGAISFTDLFSHELQGISYREALADPFLGLVTAMRSQGRLPEPARSELLASCLAHVEMLSARDEVELIPPDTSVADAASETALWQSTIRLVALRALGDWQGLAQAVRSASSVLLSTSSMVLARAGALRSFLAAQVEFSAALVGLPEVYPVDRHRRFTATLRSADQIWVGGLVALAAVIRGEVGAAESLLHAVALPTVNAAFCGAELVSHTPEYLCAMAFVALERRDLGGVVGALEAVSTSTLADYGLEEVHSLLQARLAYLLESPVGVADWLGRIAGGASMPWAHAEAVAFHIEWNLMRGQLSAAQTMLQQAQRNGLGRRHALRLALAKYRYATNRAEVALKIVVNVAAAGDVTPRHHARSLAIAASCASILADEQAAEQWRDDLWGLMQRTSLSEPLDELCLNDVHRPLQPSTDLKNSPRIRPGLALPMTRVELTKRELEVLQTLSRFSALNEIAAALHVSKNTIKTQLRHIYRKLGAHSREEALDLAMDEGLL